MFVLIGGLCWFSRASSVPSLSQDLSREELEVQIQRKTKELEDINRELSTTNQNLTDTKNQRVNLQRELSTIQRDISRLSLQIKGDETSI